MRSWNVQIRGPIIVAACGLFMPAAFSMRMQSAILMPPNPSESKEEQDET